MGRRLPRPWVWLVIGLALLALPAAARADRVQELLTQFQTFVNKKQFDEAEKVSRRMLLLAEENYGNHPSVLANFYDVAARLYDIQERYDLAEPLWKRSLAIRERIEGPRSAKLPETLQKLGDALYYTNRYDEAAKVYERSAQIRERTLGANHLDTATSWKDLGWSHLLAHHYDQAEQAFRRCLAIRENKLGKDAADVAEIVRKLGDVFYFQRRYADAAPLYKRALTIREQALGPDDPNVAVSLYDEGLNFAQLGRRAEAEADYRRALAIREQALGPDSPLVADLLYELAGLCVDTGRYLQADPYYKRALAIREKQLGPDDRGVADALDGLARVRWWLGRYDEAEPLYQRSLAIYERAQPPDELRVAAALQNLAILYSGQERYADEEPLLKRALAIREKLLSADDTRIADTLSSLATHYWNQKRYADAEQLYRRALAIREHSLPADHPEVASSLRDLADVSMRAGRFDDAEPLYQRALEMTKRSEGAEHVDVAACLSNLADLRYRQGRNEESETLYRQALSIREKALGPDHPQVAATLYDLAWLDFDLERWEDARTLLDRAIQIDNRSGVGRYTRFLRYQLRARINWQLGQKGEALADLREAIQLAEQQRGQNAGAEHGRAASFSLLTSAFERMLEWQLELGDPQEALQAIESAHARSLLDEITFSGADLDVGRPADELEQIKSREKELSDRIATLEQQLQPLLASGSATDPAMAAKRQEIVAALNEARQALFQHYQDARGSGLIYRKKLGGDFGSKIEAPRLSRIQHDVVGEQGLMLIYLLGEQGGYVMTVTAEKAQLRPLAVDEAAATALGIDAGPLTADRLQAALMPEGGSGVMQALSRPQPEASLPAKLAALWTLLIPGDERSALLAGKYQRLVVVPDGPLALLPFEALIVEPSEQPKYLLDVAPAIIYGPSATILHSLVTRSASPAEPSEEPVLTLGDPSYNETPAAAKGVGHTPTETAPRARFALLGARLDPLPYTALESRWVADVFKKHHLPTRQLLKRDATEANLRGLSAGRRLLHLACHGLTDQAYGNFYGALALTPGAHADEDQADDGFLTLAEIYGLDLHACELTILSACETNYGPQQQGEGVWALSRGFLVAGSRRVVASNWVVDDKAAASLISYFCSGLALGEAAQGRVDYAQSLTAAKRWIRSQEPWRSPYYWASFVLVGPP